MQSLLWTLNAITNRCLRISSHRSTMFNNPADFTAKIPRRKNRSFSNRRRICQSQKPIETRFEGQQEKNDFLFFLLFPAGPAPRSVFVFRDVVVVGVGQ